MVAWSKASFLALVLIVAPLAAAGMDLDASRAIPGGAAPAAADVGSTGPVDGTTPMPPVHAGTGLYFEENLGQYPDHVRFAVKGAGMPAFLTDHGAGFILIEYEEAPQDLAGGDLGGPGAAPRTVPTDGWSVFLEFLGMPTKPQGMEKLAGYSNHLKGSDPEKWVTKVPHYARVVHEDVWPGIDVVWYGTEAGLKFDVLVAPGAEPALARFTARGADALRVDSEGRLQIDTPVGRLTKDPPLAHQGDTQVDAAYRVLGATFGFALGSHDVATPLVIDPLIYSTYLGGLALDFPEDIAVDGDGNAYVAGMATSLDYPTTPGAYAMALRGRSDAFITKLDASGSALVYSTLLGGAVDESNGMRTEGAGGIDVGPTGDVWVTGFTTAHDFPVTIGAFQPVAPGGLNDAFVTRLDASGSFLGYSTFLGGSGADRGLELAVDDAGHAYVTGRTDSPDFPVSTSAVQPDLAGGADAFVAKVEPTGASLEYATYLGGIGPDFGAGVAIDAGGHAYVTGPTGGYDFPTTPLAAQSVPAGDNDAFVTRLGPGGSTMVYSTFVGGSDSDGSHGIGLDSAGRAVIAGETRSFDLPVTPPVFQASHAGGTWDGYVARIAADGRAFDHVTYLGGSDNEVINGVTVSDRDLVFVAGMTWSYDHPTTPGAIQPAMDFPTEAFVTVLAPPWTGLVESTYLGGENSDAAEAIAVDEFCSAYVVGRTGSSKFPLVAGSYDTSEPNGDAMFVSKMFHCAPPPLAAFTAPDSLCYNRPAAFTFLGVPGDPRFPLAQAWWDLGDGSQRVDRPPADFVHTYTAPGRYAVALNVTDVLGVEVRAAGEVTAVNCPPYVDPVRNYTIYQEETVAFTVTGGDPNLDLAGLTAEMLPAGATFDPSTGRFSWTPTKNQAGTYRIDFWAVDPYGLTATRSMWIKVLERPEPVEEGLPDLRLRMPRSGDADGDGMPDGMESCPAEAASRGACNVVEAAFLERACREFVPRPDHAEAAWQSGRIQVNWTHDTPCPVAAYLVWNGTVLVAVVPGNATSAFDDDPWRAPHRYHVQGILAGESHQFIRDRSRATNIVQAPLEDAAGPSVIHQEDPRPVGALGEMVGVKRGPGLTPFVWGGLGLIALLLTAWYALTRPAFLRLFSRIKDDEVLEHPLRAEIAAIVAADPGIHMTEVLRRTDKANGVVRHHVAKLLDAGVVTRKEVNGYVCLYPPDVPRRLHEAGGLLRSVVARRVLQEIAASPGASVADLARCVGANPWAVRYHLERFSKAGLATMDTGAVFPARLTGDALATLAPELSPSAPPP